MCAVGISKRIRAMDNDLKDEGVTHIAQKVEHFFSFAPDARSLWETKYARPDVMACEALLAHSRLKN